jgi:ribonuclease VapC
MSSYVLDSYALIAFLQKEPGWEYISRLIRSAIDGTVELHMSVINLAEVYYTIERRGKSTPHMLSAIKALPIHIASADAYIEQIISIKAKYAISLADCFAAALAVDLHCPLVTGDPEFKKLESFLTVEWLR